jgi:hypothetical protein
MQTIKNVRKLNRNLGKCRPGISCDCDGYVKWLLSRNHLLEQKETKGTKKTPKPTARDLLGL